MNSVEKTNPDAITRSKGIAAGTLGLIIGSAVLGSAATVLVMRSMAGGIESISTTGLLNFLFMLGLSAAAIVLSVTAISLSRLAERTISQKSQEISTMQTAMVSQTVSAIERMESSVTQIGSEITDSIYDNFEMLSEDIQESLPSRDVLRADVTEAVEHSLADAMIVVENEFPVQEEVVAIPEEEVDEAIDEEPEPEPVASEEVETVAEKVEPEVIPEPVPEPITDEMREKADKKYGEFKDIVLLGVANYPGVVSRKIGEGQYRTEGDELVDGAFVLKNERLAVCTFCTGNVILDRFLGENGESFNGFLKSLSIELKKGHFTRVFLVFDGSLTNGSPYSKSINELGRHSEAETFARFELFEGSPDIIIPELTERVSQLMESDETLGDEEDVPSITFREQMLG